MKLCGGAEVQGENREFGTPTYLGGAEKAGSSPEEEPHVTQLVTKSWRRTLPAESEIPTQAKFVKFTTLAINLNSISHYPSRNQILCDKNHRPTKWLQGRSKHFRKPRFPPFLSLYANVIFVNRKVGGTSRNPNRRRSLRKY